MSGQTIAITQHVTDEAFLRFCSEQHIHLVQAPQITFKTVPFEVPSADAFEVVFFSSKRSVESFFSRATVAPHHLIACIGKSTAKALTKYVKEIHFIGQKSGKPSEVAKAFKNFVGQKKVLFPQSQVSNRSMQQKLAPSQLIDLITYNTISTPLKIKEKLDYLVFTSPSNVNAFFECNQLQPHCSIISWGDTTTKQLLEYSIQPDVTLEESSFEALIRVLKMLW